MICEKSKRYQQDHQFKKSSKNPRVRKFVCVFLPLKWKLQICTRLPRYARRLLDDPRLLDHLCTHQASQQINTKKKKGEEEVLLERLCVLSEEGSGRGITLLTSPMSCTLPFVAFPVCVCMCNDVVILQKNDFT